MSIIACCLCSRHHGLALTVALAPQPWLALAQHPPFPAPALTSHPFPACPCSQGVPVEGPEGWHEVLNEVVLSRGSTPYLTNIEVLEGRGRGCYGRQRAAYGCAKTAACGMVLAGGAAGARAPRAGCCRFPLAQAALPCVTLTLS